MGKYMKMLLLFDCTDYPEWYYLRLNRQTIEYDAYFGFVWGFF